MPANTVNALAIRGVLITPIGNTPPTITSFSPAQSEPNTQVTITSTHFDDRGPSYNKVSFCCINGPTGIPAPVAQVLMATPTSLGVPVPVLAGTGKLRVTSNNLSVESATDFQVVPVITSLSQTCLGVGDNIANQRYGLLRRAVCRRLRQNRQR